VLSTQFRLVIDLDNLQPAVLGVAICFPRCCTARAFVECKAEIRAANARDDGIVGNVEQISAVLKATFLTVCIDGHHEQFAEPFGGFSKLWPSDSTTRRAGRSIARPRRVKRRTLRSGSARTPPGRLEIGWSNARPSPL